MIQSPFYDYVSWFLLILGITVIGYILFFGGRKVSQGVFLALGSLALGILMVVYKLITK